jgi:hypothetical protein
MYKQILDHEKAMQYALNAKRQAEIGTQTMKGFLDLAANCFQYIAPAYLDMVAQRDYWRTLYTGGVGELPLENNAHAQGETA